MFYFDHFQTLSGKLSAFWHILYGKSVKRAFYMSNGKKRFCLEKLTFFHHHPTLSWKYSGFCITFFCELLKSAFLLAKIKNLRKSISFQKHFLIIFTHLAKKLQSFWGISFAWQPKVHSTCPMDSLNIWKQRLLLKKSFLRHLWTSSEKTRLLLNVFRRGFQICNHCQWKQSLSKKTYFSKTAFW